MFSETSVNFYRTLRYHMSQHSTLHCTHFMYCIVTCSESVYKTTEIIFHWDNCNTTVRLNVWSNVHVTSLHKQCSFQSSPEPTARIQPWLHSALWLPVPLGSSSAACYMAAPQCTAFTLHLTQAILILQLLNRKNCFACWTSTLKKGAVHCPDTSMASNRLYGVISKIISRYTRKLSLRSKCYFNFVLKFFKFPFCDHS
jgi:hypothetical protein